MKRPKTNIVSRLSGAVHGSLVSARGLEPPEQPCWWKVAFLGGVLHCDVTDQNSSYWLWLGRQRGFTSLFLYIVWCSCKSGRFTSQRWYSLIWEAKKPKPESAWFPDLHVVMWSTSKAFISSFHVIWFVRRRLIKHTVSHPQGERVKGENSINICRTMLWWTWSVHGPDEAIHSNTSALRIQHIILQRTYRG